MHKHHSKTKNRLPYCILPLQECALSRITPQNPDKSTLDPQAGQLAASLGNITQFEI
jgi:hypothetical protein